MAAESAVRIIFTGNASGAVRSINSLERSFGTLGRTAKIAAGAIGVGMAVALGAAAKAALDFDRAMRNVQSLTKQSEASFQALEKRVLALAGPTGQAPKTLAEGLYDIVSSGFQANDAITILAASAKAATAGMTDTATATKAVVAILNAYHLSAGKARDVSDVLFQEVNLGVNTFEELAQNIGDTAPAAAALGIPFSQVSAALATITRQGNDMSLASTQVARVLISLIKPSKGMTTELKHMGFESGQAAIKSLGFSGVVKQLSKDAKGNQQTLIDWTGDIRGFRGIVGLTGKNLETYTKLVKQMGSATAGVGATQAAFAEQAKSISFQWQRAKVTLTAAAIPIGQLLFPALIKGAQGVTFLANTLQQHMPQIKRLTNEATRAIADGWTRYAVPAMRVAQQVVNTVSAFIRAHWSQIRSTSLALGHAIQQGFAVAKQAIQALLPVARALAPVFSAAFSAALAILRAFAVVAATSMRLTAAEINIVKAVVRPFGGVFSAAFSVAAATVKAAGSVITGILSGINAAINGTISALHALSSAIGAVKSLPGKVAGHIPHIPGFADGGFVPGAAGSPRLILAHAGEVVLNSTHQAMLGGAGFFRSMFGFSGDDGPSFAAGGTVGSKSFLSKKPPHAPHKGRAHRSHTGSIPPWASPQIKSALSHLHHLDDDKQYLDQEYGNLVTRFQIEDGDQTFLNDDGTINTGFVAQRTTELQDLLAEREKLIAKMEEQKKVLAKAVAMLKKAIGQLLKNLKAQTRRVHADANLIGQLSNQIAAESRKKKPDKKRLDSLRGRLKNAQTDQREAKSSITDIRGARDTWEGQISDWGHDLRFLPLDEGGIQNDILDLNQQLGWLGTPDLIKKHYGGGTGGGGAAAAAATPPNLAGFAAAIGTLQSNIIGSFQKGSLYVPNTGLAMLHSGEQVIPAGQRGGDGGSIGDVQVQIQVANGMEWLKDYITVTATSKPVVDAISLKTGNSASERSRSGRY